MTNEEMLTVIVMQSRKKHPWGDAQMKKEQCI